MNKQKSKSQAKRFAIQGKELAEPPDMMPKSNDSTGPRPILFRPDQDQQKPIEQQMAEQQMIPMVEAAINWVKYKAYEIEDEKKDNLLSVLRLAQMEYNDLKTKIDELETQLAVYELTGR